jgi:hypothetical protein
MTENDLASPGSLSAIMVAAKCQQRIYVSRAHILHICVDYIPDINHASIVLIMAIAS